MSNLKNNKIQTFSKIKYDTDFLKNLIVSRRELKNYSQRQLARRIGISNAAISDLEGGLIQKPSVEILIKISEELDVSISELLKTSGYGKLLTLIKKEEVNY